VRHYLVAFCVFIERGKVKIQVKKGVDGFFCFSFVFFTYFFVGSQFSKKLWLVNGARRFNGGENEFLVDSYNLPKLAFLVTANLLVTVSEDFSA